MLSCLFSLHFTGLYLSNWHAPSLRYIVTHGCLHPPSLCISLLLCLLLTCGFCCAYLLPAPHVTLISSSLSIPSSIRPDQIHICTVRCNLSSLFYPITLPFSLDFSPSPPYILLSFLLLTPSSSYLCFSSPPPSITCLCSTLSASRYVGRLVKSSCCCYGSTE